MLNLLYSNQSALNSSNILSDNVDQINADSGLGATIKQSKTFNIVMEVIF